MLEQLVILEIDPEIITIDFVFTRAKLIANTISVSMENLSKIINIKDSLYHDRFIVALPIHTFGCIVSFWNCLYKEFDNWDLQEDPPTIAV